MTVLLSNKSGNTAGRGDDSLIKPFLTHLSGSGTLLNGIIVERNLHAPGTDFDAGNLGSPEHVIVLHAKNPATLACNIDGRPKKSRFTEGDAIINPHGRFIAPQWSDTVEALLLAINPSLIDRVAEEMDLPGKVELIPRFQFRDDLLRQLMHHLVAAFENGQSRQTKDTVYVESITHALIAHITRNHSLSGKAPKPARSLPPRRLARVTEYINDNLHKELSLEAIAQVAAFSPSYFATLFKNATGLSPHRYIIGRRISKARHLLLNTSQPISQIAYQTGFADQSHLTRLMRRHTGLTPWAIRNR